MARVTLSDYQTGRIPIPDFRLKAVSAGVVVKFLLGTAVVLTIGDFSYLFWAAAVAGGITALMLPLSQLSVSSRLIDGSIEGGIASAIGFTLVFPVYAVGAWGGYSEMLNTGDAILTTGAMLPFQYVMFVLATAAGGMVGGFGGALLYQLYRKLRY